MAATSYIQANRTTNGNSQRQSSRQQQKSQSTGTSTQDSTSDGYSMRVVDPAVRQQAQNEYNERMRSLGYVQDTNSPNGWSKDPTLFDALKVNRDNLKAERERQEKINRNRQLGAAIAETARLVSDMGWGAAGGNVYRREKDTTATDAMNENKRLREQQIADDIAAQEKDRQDYLAAAREAMAARDAYIRDFSKQVNHSQGRSTGNSTQRGSSSGTSSSSSTSTGWQNQDVNRDYINAIPGGGGANANASSGGSGSTAVFNVISTKKNGAPVALYMPTNVSKSAVPRVYNNLVANGYIKRGKNNKEPTFEQKEQMVRETIERLDRAGINPSTGKLVSSKKWGEKSNHNMNWSQVRGTIISPLFEGVSQPGGYQLDGWYNSGGYSAAAPWMTGGDNSNAAPWLQ